MSPSGFILNSEHVTMPYIDNDQHAMVVVVMDMNKNNIDVGHSVSGPPEIIRHAFIVANTAFRKLGQEE